MGYFSAWYLSDIARLPILVESYFRNNADLGTGLLIANFAITSPHFFGVCPRISPTRFSLIFSNNAWKSCILAVTAIPFLEVAF